MTETLHFIDTLKSTRLLLDFKITLKMALTHFQTASLHRAEQTGA